MIKHTYIQTTIISDKGSAFVSHVIKEVADVLGIILTHAKRMHAQKLGELERSHASIKQALKIETGEGRSLWLKHVNIAVLKNNRSHHAIIGSGQIRVFHGRIPYVLLGRKLGVWPQQAPIHNSQAAQVVLEQTGNNLPR